MSRQKDEKNRTSYIGEPTNSERSKVTGRIRSSSRSDCTCACDCRQLRRINKKILKIFSFSNFFIFASLSLKLPLPGKGLKLAEAVRSSHFLITQVKIFRLPQIFHSHL
jgi:hypothetical protein